MKSKKRNFILVSSTVVTWFLAVLCGAMIFSENIESTSSTPTLIVNPIMSVVAISPQEVMLPVRILAYGNIMVWQEASIGNEADSLRLTDVRVDVGDTVKKGQVLASFVSDAIEAELVQIQASVEEAAAVLAEAKVNAERARELKTTNAIPTQQVQQYLTAEQTATARLRLAKAIEKRKHIQLTQTQVHAPDDGIISARSASVGSVPASGEELFKMIRQGRLEWRAEVAADDLEKLIPGQLVHIITASGRVITGRMRIAAPQIDMRTRNALVYVDLPHNSGLRAGMFVQGSFEVDNTPALTLPHSAVMVRDGFSYVFRINSDAKVVQTKITTGRRSTDQIEVLNGIDPISKIVATGGAFLGDGDRVRVVENNIEDGINSSSLPW